MVEVADTLAREARVRTCEGTEDSVAVFEQTVF